MVKPSAAIRQSDYRKRRIPAGGCRQPRPRGTDSVFAGVESGYDDTSFENIHNSV